MPLCEATMSCRFTERYERHRYVERLMKNDMSKKREYTWASVGTYTVKIRCVTNESEEWRPVIIPKPDSLIRFEMDAHLRVSQKPRDGRGHRRSNTGYLANLDWIERKSGEIGIKLRAVDYDPLKVPIDYPDAPFVKDGSRFRGVATVVDPTKLLTALTFGIGDAKSFGFGFLSFHTVEA